MKELENKLDKILDTQITHGKLLAVQTAQLKEHMRRSDLLEKKIDIEIKAIEEDIEPLEDHVKGVRFMGKAIIGLGAVSGAILAILKLVGTL